ncbi:MAG: hypothetical protein JO002_10805 [Burkholderiaceae bacterium]|nr:hypothetical protein [Burkholderiaceae bacterium]
MKSLSLLLPLVIVAGSVSAQQADISTTERLGTLRLNLPEAEAKQAVACPMTAGKEQKWEADGAYHQEWHFACGVDLGMMSERKGGKKTVQTIKIHGASTLKTSRGIGLGASEQDVTKAYAKEWSKDESKMPDLFVAGSLYGGVMFTFKEHRVSEIFVGAAAE